MSSSNGAPTMRGVIARMSRRWSPSFWLVRSRCPEPTPLRLRVPASDNSSLRLPVLERALTIKLREDLHPESYSDPAARHPRGLASFKQFALRRAMFNRAFEMRLSSFASPHKHENARHDHLAVFDGQRLSF